ncbi:hypothetical protein B0H11DRAFT_2237671 [Mycena galericulata]|nr:hypothetical protein B0H11DRAFT_2237671 [Mycena galericulata]
MGERFPYWLRSSSFLRLPSLHNADTNLFFLSLGIATSSPFAMPMSTPTMSPDEMLRAYAKTHTTTSGSVSLANAGSSNRGSSSPSIVAKALLLSLVKGGAPKASHLSKVSNSTQGAEVMSSLHGTGMRVLYGSTHGRSFTCIYIRAVVCTYVQDVSTLTEHEVPQDISHISSPLPKDTWDSSLLESLSTLAIFARVDRIPHSFVYCDKRYI